MIVGMIAANAADLWLSWGIVTEYGLGAEANPLMRGALGLGLLGGIALKAGLLAVVLAAAALNPRRSRLLVGAGIVVGLVGAASAWMA